MGRVLNERPTPTSGAPRPAAAPWGVVLPVKGGRRAKSRLGAPDSLALAIAMDCLDAVVACPEDVVAPVVVVTADAQVAAAAATTRAEVVADPGGGLDAAVAAGLAALGSARPRAVLLADLPSLRPQDLVAALVAASRHASALVPDARGDGTVLLTWRPGLVRATRFGPGSAAAHAADGAHRLELDLPRLRGDVDVPADLAAALARGTGPRTTAAALADPPAAHTTAGSSRSTRAPSAASLSPKCS